MRANTTITAIPGDGTLIADTSALVAAANKELGHAKLRDALVSPNVKIPAPVVVEFERVTSLARNRPDPNATAFLGMLVALGAEVIAFDATMAQAAAAANESYGSGNGRGSLLNMLDLIVYGVAKITGMPILCTGNDFITTDALIHPASRIG